MENKVHTFSLNIDWELILLISQIDRFYASWTTIEKKEGQSLKNLHNILMKYSKKDEWHKGNHKQHSNAVEAKLPDGTRQIIFQTTEAEVVQMQSQRYFIERAFQESKQELGMSDYQVRG